MRSLGRGDEGGAANDDDAVIAVADSDDDDDDADRLDCLDSGRRGALGAWRVTVGHGLCVSDAARDVIAAAAAKTLRGKGPPVCRSRRRGRTSD